jgi:alpha/beta superfamily hydrolase
VEGWQVWDLALACAGQLRIAPSGVVLGFDYGAVLAMAALRDVSVNVLASLLPAIEAALGSAVNASQDQDA